MSTGEIGLETSYPVAIGRPGWETPTGEFEVFSQIVDPGWTNPITGESMAPGKIILWAIAGLLFGQMGLTLSAFTVRQIENLLGKRLLTAAFVCTTKMCTHCSIWLR